MDHNNKVVMNGLVIAYLLGVLRIHFSGTRHSFIM